MTTAAFAYEDELFIPVLDEEFDAIGPEEDAEHILALPLSYPPTQ